MLLFICMVWFWWRHLSYFLSIMLNCGYWFFLESTGIVVRVLSIRHRQKIAFWTETRSDQTDQDQPLSNGRWSLNQQMIFSIWNIILNVKVHRQDLRWSLFARNNSNFILWEFFSPKYSTGPSNSSTLIHNRSDMSDTQFLGIQPAASQKDIHLFCFQD